MVYNRQVRDQQDMKLHNRALVWDIIFNERPVSRAQLAKMTDMSPTSITRIVAELTDFGLLRETPDTHAGVGRKATMLDIDRDAFFTLGIDVDVDSIQTCLLDLDNAARSALIRKTPGRETTPEMFMDIAHEMYREMLGITGIAAERVRAVGVSVSGIIERGTGRLVVSPQLQWTNVPIRVMAEARFGLAATVENDVKAAIYEEYVRNRECRAGTLAYLTVGHGIGSAVMCDGQVIRGGDNAAGEIGHITVRLDGEPCDCGRRGCLYTYLSEKALSKRISQLSGRARGPKSIERWVREYREGAAWARDMTDETAGYLAMAINHTLCSFNPEITIVGGKLLYAFPELLELALAKKGYIYEALREHTRVVPSRSRDKDSVIGAAIIAKEAHLDGMLRGREWEREKSENG